MLDVMHSYANLGMLVQILILSQTNLHLDIAKLICVKISDINKTCYNYCLFRTSTHSVFWAFGKSRIWWLEYL